MPSTINFEGELTEVLLKSSCSTQISYQSCVTDDCILVYENKTIKVFHRHDGECLGFELFETGKGRFDDYDMVIRPEKGESIAFGKILNEDGIAAGLQFTWNGSYFCIFRSTDTLTITTRSVDRYTDPDCDEPDTPTPLYIVGRKAK